MSIQPGQTVFYTSKYNDQERSGTVQEATSIGYLINNTWFAKEDIKIKNVLLDSKSNQNPGQLILG
jgi:hypothetical protein